MLNDVSGLTRKIVFGQSLGFGLIFGSIFVFGRFEDADRGFVVGLAVAMIGFVFTIMVAVALSVVGRRAQQRLVAEAVTGSEPIVRGDLRPDVVPGRLIRHRRAKDAPGFVLSSPAGLAGPTSVIVATALDQHEARRVAAVIPTSLAKQIGKGPVALRLHPTMREVAVVDDTVSPETVAQIHTDSRWSTSKIPTDRSVAGGWSVLLLLVPLGVALGTVIDFLIVTPFT